MPPSIKAIIIIIVIIGGSFAFLAALPFLAAIGACWIVYYFNKLLTYNTEDTDDKKDAPD